MIVVIDGADKIVYVSSTMAEMLNYTQLELVGHNYSNLVHPHDIAQLQRLQSEETIGQRPLELQMKHQDGSWRTFEMLYMALGDGYPKRGGYALFKPEMHDDSLERQVELEAQLRQALESKQFEVHYQPKIELSSSSVIGMEALVRWQHPQLGLIPPNDFIPVAEETGLICELGLWVLEEACRQIRIWNTPQNSPVPLVVSVNLSAVQLQQPDLVDKIAQILQKTKALPEWVQLEIAENMLMDESEGASLTLRHLKQLGLKLAVDDFGMGYSRPGYLRYLTLDTIKIDRAFVSNLNEDAKNYETVQEILRMGRVLKLQVVAEGVENVAELIQLKKLGCQLVQGYYFAKPMPAREITDLLRQFKYVQFLTDQHQQKWEKK
ncbi:MAG: EAL domain-containing protein [Chloroflexi bacterium]|nr:EAL domain-containing protein [Chloroflexota bacterium]